MSAPDDDNVQAWNDYLLLAWHRNNERKSGDYPRIQTLAAAGSVDYDTSLKELQEELQLLSQWSDTLVVGSASPKDLIAVMQEFAVGTSPGALRSRQIILALADDDFTIARDALLPAGAQVVQIDPTVPIPQSEQNLRELAESEQGYAEEVAARERHGRGRAHWWQGY